MSKTIPLSSEVGVVGSIDPDAAGAGTYTSGWISAAQFQRFMAILSVGTMAATSTVNMKIEQATDGSGTGVKDLTGAAISELSQAGTDDSDSQAAIALFSDSLDLENGFDHFRVSVTVAAAASDLGVVILGSGLRVGPVEDRDAATVAEIVVA